MAKNNGCSHTKRAAVFYLKPSYDEVTQVFCPRLFREGEGTGLRLDEVQIVVCFVQSILQSFLVSAEAIAGATARCVSMKTELSIRRVHNRIHAGETRRCYGGQTWGID